MPRTPRIHIDGALYYVTAQSASDVLLFTDQRDYQTYLEYLKEYQARFGFRLYAFLLTPRQLHLCLELADGATISAVMHAIHSRYTKYAIKRQGRSGQLFQGRFRSTLVEKDAMLLSVTGFLHRELNTQELFDQTRLSQWSSLPAYLGGSQYDIRYAPHVEVDEVLQRLQTERPGSDYAAYLQSFSEEELRRLEASLHQTAVGSDRFVAMVRQRRNELSTQRPSPVAPVAPVAAALPVAEGTELVRRRALLRWGSRAVATVVVLGVAAAATGHWLPLVLQRGLIIVRHDTPMHPQPEHRMMQASTGLQRATAPVLLNGTFWDIQIRPANTMSDSAQFRTDQLRFFDGRKMTSLRLDEQGFEWSNYTSSEEPNGAIRWETMQTGPGGETVCWSGESNGEMMRGIMTRQLPGKVAMDFTFVGVPSQMRRVNQLSNEI